MHKYFLLFLTILALLPCTGCEKKPVPKPAIKIGIEIWAGDAYTFIAQEKGFFKKNGVDVELVLRENTIETRKAYTNNETDCVFGLLSDMIILNTEGTPAKLVFLIDQSTTGDVIIGRPELHSLQDLKRKKISFEGLNTFSHLFVLKQLENAGLKESEVFLKNIEGLHVLEALENGRIDAGHTWDPIKTEALGKGYRVLATAVDLPGIIIDGLFFSPKFVDERPDEIRLIIKSLLEARAYVYSHWEESIGLMAKAEGMSYSAMQSGVLGVKHFDLKDNVEAFSKGEDLGSLYWSFKTSVDFFMARGQMSVPPPFEEIVEPKFVLQLWEDAKGK